MNSLILQSATRLLVTLMFLFAVFLLIRGHNEPGGGFVGGLIAVGGFALYAMAFGVEEARRALRVSPRTLVGMGLVFAFLSGLVAAGFSRPYLTGYWVEWHVSESFELAFGTPTLFDIGVFLVVIGATLTAIFALEEE